MRVFNIRVLAMYRSWYQPEYRMRSEEYMYIGLLLLTCILSWGLGLVLGFLWTLCI
jgi:hypothetical protein